VPNFYILYLNTIISGVYKYAGEGEAQFD